MKKTRKILSLAVMLFTACMTCTLAGARKEDGAGPLKVLSGKPDYSRDLDRSYSIRPGAGLHIEHAMGPVEVKTGTGKKVRVEGVERAKVVRALARLGG